MNKFGTICAALLLAAGSGCRVNVDRGRADDARAAELAGTYVTAAHGNTFDKDWSYSGALVLDSTGHFGTTFTLASDNDPPQQTSLRGSYHITTTTHRRSGHVISTTKITLVPAGVHSDRPVLLVSGDSLKYSGPWWFRAALGALSISDPVFLRDSGVTSVDSAGGTVAGGEKSTGSTPATSRKSSPLPQTKTTPSRSPTAKK